MQEPNVQESNVQSRHPCLPSIDWFARAAFGGGLALVISASPAFSQDAGPSGEASDPTEVAPESTEEVELTLTPPINSTLEIRVAKRPWLLEKLVGEKNEPSEKMDPPTPLPDPPSMALPARRATPKPLDRVEDRWTPRRNTVAKPSTSQRESKPSVAKPGVAKLDTAPKPSRSSQPSYRTDEPTLRLVTPNSSPESMRVSQPNEAVLARPQTLKDIYSETPQPLRDPMPLRAAPPASSVKPQGPKASVTPKQSRDESVRVDDLNAEERSSASRYISDDQPDSLGPPQAFEDVMTRRRSNSGMAPQSEFERIDNAPAELPPATAQRERTPMQSSDRPDLEPAPAASTTRIDSTSLDYVGRPKTPIELTRTTRQMQNMMRACLTHYYRDAEIANERSNWGMMHAIMVYGIDTKVVVDGRTYSTIAWIAGNNACRGQRLLDQRDGRIVVKSGVGLQGHQGQMLAVFSLCDVPSDYPLYAGDTQFSVKDVVDEEMLACKSGEELTFTLIGLSHYLDTESSWKSEDGQTWNFERLIREELAQPVVGAACGGTHRLMGFAHALRKRRMEGRPIEGQWARAQTFVDDFVDYTYQLQNRDGSMSTDWFEGREDNGDMDRKIQTTGHMVEWLLTVTPDSELQNPRLLSAVRYLLTTMYKERGHDWSIGPKGHALRSLAMFYDRVYQSGPAWQAPMSARGTSSPRR